MTYPDAPEGGGSNRWMIIGGAALLGVLGILWYRHKQSTSGTTSATSGASLGSTPYGPTQGFGSVVPVIIQTPSGPTIDTTGGVATGSSSVPSPTPTTNGATNLPTAVPVPPSNTRSLSPSFTPQGVNVPQWATIPGPTIGSGLAASGVPWQTSGRAQYYDPSVLREISNPAVGQQLLNEGYNVFAIGGREMYYPGQRTNPKVKGKYYR